MNEKNTKKKINPSLRIEITIIFNIKCIYFGDDVLFFFFGNLFEYFIETNNQILNKRNL